MFVPCPQCGFLVALIAPRGGATEQRCPRCRQVLTNARAPHADDAEPQERTRLTREHPAARPERAEMRAVAGPVASPAARAPTPAPEPEPMAAPVTRARPVSQAAAADATPTGPRGARASASNRPDASTRSDSAPRAPGRAEPSFARGRGGAPRRAHEWPVHAGVAALGLLLAAQLLLAQRDSLAADPRWRPAVSAACAITGCTVRPWREPTAFTMLDRSVQPKPATPGVLSAQATFRNDAQWPQPWPTLLLSLSGVDGRTLGSRAFEPHEYAGGPVAALAPGQSARVQLDIVEPAPDVVAFSFDFR